MLMQRRTMLIVLAIALAAVAIAYFSATVYQQPGFSSVQLNSAGPAPQFDLPDQNGTQRKLDDYRGKVVVLFFGYTQCPDVCPTMMAELAQVKKELGTQSDKVQGLFVTLDPARDTPAVLKAYMENFDPGFLALRPSEAALPDLARTFHLYYKRVDGRTPTDYTLDHSAGSFVYDPQGRLRLFTRYGTTPAALTRDIRLLLARG